MSSLQTILDQTDFAWSLGLIGEDQAGKLATLTGDLRRRTSTSGDGKRVTSGFSYLGAEPAIAWANACRDHLYPVMKESIESFDRRWCAIRPMLSQPYHYVSLGPGDGRKDAVILQDLRRNNAQLCYVAVDMSTEMLRLGVHEVIRQFKISRSRILPVQLDFSSAANVAELRRLLQRVFGDAPMLFSLLGNTMANFENDTKVLKLLAAALLRPQDRFVVEVATTQRLEPALAQEAGEEYGRSRTFREFVTSALMHYTDLQIDMESLLFQGTLEEGRSLFVKVIYQNRTGRDFPMTLPDRTTVTFPNLDTILLLVTRKYARSALDAVFLDSGVRKLHSSHFELSCAPHGAPFGMELVVLGQDDQGAAVPEQSIAADIWRRY
jgi:uncharacterized SAM-dependent methyltransferase